MRHLRHPTSQADPLEKRFAAEAIRLRDEANKLPPGAARESLLRRARQAETGARMIEWLRSPGLQPPT
jgi:hypothetical protein